MDNLDEIISGLTPEQQLEVTMIFDTLGKELEHADGVKELKLILEARAEAIKMIKQFKKDEQQ
jgi:hypothetical protein